MRASVLSLAFLLFAGAAWADDVRFPERNTPAFVIPVPGDWVASTDNDDNMQVSSRAKNVLLVLSIGPSAGSLDDFAAGMLQSDRKSTRLNSSHYSRSRMPSSA